MSLSNSALQRPHPPTRYDQSVNTGIQSCFVNTPTVYCSRSRDCRRWMSKNCSDGDVTVGKSYCDVGGTCIFVAKGSEPPFVRGAT